MISDAAQTKHRGLLSVIKEMEDSVEASEEQVNEIVEGAGIIDHSNGELIPMVPESRDIIPVPHIYFGSEIKRFNDPIYEKVPAFTQSWLLRIMHYRFYQYKYVLKSDLNQCLHANLRRKNLKVNFGMKWIWAAVRGMIECDEEWDNYRLLEWVYEDEFNVKKRKRNSTEDVVQGLLPTRIRLSPYGKKVALQLGEGSKKHNKMAKPPPEQRRDDLSDSEEFAVPEGPVHMLSPESIAASLAEHEDLKTIMGHVELLVAEIATLRKEKIAWMQGVRPQTMEVTEQPHYEGGHQDDTGHHVAVIHATVEHEDQHEEQSNGEYCS